MKKLNKELSGEGMVVELPQHLKQKITDEILQRLKTLNANASVSEQRGTCFSTSMGSWRMIARMSLYSHYV